MAYGQKASSCNQLILDVNEANTPEKRLIHSSQCKLECTFLGIGLDIYWL